MVCYIKEDVIKSISVHGINFENPCNFLVIEQMHFGAVINSSSCPPNVLDYVKKWCVQFDIESIKQIFLRFQFVKHWNLYWSTSGYLKKKIKTITIADITTHFPNLVNVTHV